MGNTLKSDKVTKSTIESGLSDSRLLQENKGHNEISKGNLKTVESNCNKQCVVEEHFLGLLSSGAIFFFLFCLLSP